MNSILAKISNGCRLISKDGLVKVEKIDHYEIACKSDYKALISIIR